MSAISDRVLYRGIVDNTIVYLLPNSVQSAGDKHHGGLSKKEVGSRLGMPQGNIHKTLSRYKQPIFSNRIE